MSLWVVLACTAALELWVLRRLRFDWAIVTMVLASTALCVHYLTYTSIAERNYDGESHLEYIQTIALHGRLPDAFACGACGHPPLYYALAAVWSKTASIGGWLSLEQGLQWLSLLLFFGFVVFALLILRSSVEGRSPLWLGAALVVFWPSSVLNSARVHNDALAAPLLLASMYFLAQWDRQGKMRDFYAALSAAALAVLTKSTGYPMAATVLLFAAAGLRSATLRGQSILRCVAAIALLGGASLLAVGTRESRDGSTLCQKVMGSACDGRYVPPVADTPSRFLYFDAPAFLRRIDTAPEDPKRDYFLNRLVKSSLFGTMPLGDELGGKRHHVLAVAISALLLGMASTLALATALLGGVRWRRYRVYLGASAALLACLVAFRLRAPNEFHEDFRHIFPALVPFCLGYTATVQRLGKVSRWLGGAGFALGLALVTASIAFFVRLP